jgi:mono/diheme cytochrome c family protein
MNYVYTRGCNPLTRWFACAAALLIAWCARAEPAAPPAPTAQAMAVLRDNCVGCHNPEKKKGKLLLTSRADALRGNEDGPALAPGKPDESLLLKVLAAGADPHMPPKKQLSDADVAALRGWI